MSIKKYNRLFRVLPVIGLLLCLSGCENKNDWKGFLAEKAGEAGNAVVSGIDKGIDSLKEHGSIGEHAFENEEEAEAVLLTGLEERYKTEFIIIEKKSYTEYGPFYGDVYIAKVAPAKDPEMTAWGRVLQSGLVTDDYGKHFFKEKAEEEALKICEGKEYVTSFSVELEGGYTQRAWSGEEKLQEFMVASNGYVRISIVLPSGKSVDEYTEWMADFLGSLAPLTTDICVSAKNGEAWNALIFFHDFSADGENSPERFTEAEIREEIESCIQL